MDRPHRHQDLLALPHSVSYMGHTFTCRRLPQAACVHADPGMIEQVVMNLAINARDAMPDGGELSISVESIILKEAEILHRFEARAGHFICITVTVAFTASSNTPMLFPSIINITIIITPTHHYRY